MTNGAQTDLLCLAEDLGEGSVHPGLGLFTLFFVFSFLLFLFPLNLLVIVFLLLFVDWDDLLLGIQLATRLK